MMEKVDKQLEAAQKAVEEGDRRERRRWKKTNANREHDRKKLQAKNYEKVTNFRKSLPVNFKNPPRSGGSAMPQ